MSLTTGRGPFGPDPAGRFDLPVPVGAVYVEPLLRRVRAVIGDRTVIDSERVVLVHRSGSPPAYAFPGKDVPGDLPHAPEPAAQGYMQVPWDAVTAWYEEDEQVLGHPRNPYHRIDCVRTRRRLRVTLGTAVLVDTTDAIAMYETAKAPQLYVSPHVVCMKLLVDSSTMTYCPYKGHARYWTARVGDTLVPDVAWCYQEPHPECSPVAGLLCFDPGRTTLSQDVPTWFEIPSAAVTDLPAGAEHEPSRG